MKILIANYEFPPYGGGASKVSYELARRLVASGHEVHVLTSRFGDVPKLESIDGIIVHRVWSWRKGVHDCGLRGAFTYLLSALPRLRYILNTESIDLVHYFFGLPTGFLSLYSHSIRGVPYIISLRGSDVPLYDLDSRKLVFMHWLTRPISRHIWSRAAKVIAVSGGLRELATASIPGVDVDVIYNGVDVAGSSDTASSKRDDSCLRLLCVSRLIPRKGVADLLHALSITSDIEFELTLAGTGPSFDTLHELAQTLDIADKINMVGYCARDQVAEHYLNSDIFILPTHSDAFANVVLEAMSAALPVIACDVGGVAEKVIDGKTGLLVAPGQPMLLAAAIRELAADKSKRLKFGRAGQQRVQEHFTWSRNAERHVAAYRAATKSRSFPATPRHQSGGRNDGNTEGLIPPVD